MVNAIKNKIQIENIVIVLLMAMLICQIGITTYFSMFKAQEHMGLDSSWEYTKVNLSIKEGELYPHHVINTTTQPEFERIVLILPLYYITHNLFYAYGLANLIVIIIALFLIYKITTNYNWNSAVPKLICMNLFMCPYLANGYYVDNDLSYYECVNGFAAYQNILTLAILMVILFISYETMNKKSVIIGIITSLLIIYVSICKGMGLLVWIGVPLFVFVLIKAIITNDVKVFFNRKNCFIYLFIVSIVLGRFIGGMLGYQYLDSNTVWVDAVQFLHNVGNEFVATFTLLGALPSEGVRRTPSSFMGLVYCFGLILVVCLYIAFVYGLNKVIAGIKKSEIENESVLFLEVMIIINVLIFSLVMPYMDYSQFEMRYLIPCAHAGFLLLGFFIDDLSDNLILKKFGLGILFLSIAGMNFYSDYFLSAINNSNWHVEAIHNVIDDTDAELVYFFDEEKFLVRPERVLRVIDPNRVYKCVSYGNMLENMGDYNYYDSSSEYNGPTVLVTKKGEKPIKKEIISQYRKLDSVEEYDIYYADNNPIDLEKMTVLSRP